MSDLSSQIASLVDDFVAQVTTIARQAAMDTLTTSLGSQNGGGRRPGRQAVAAPAPAPSRRATLLGTPGAKRPAEALAHLKDQLAAHIQANPGSRIEQIGKTLGFKTKELALPIKKLIAEGTVKTEGAKRATTYSPATGKRGKKAA